MPEKLTPEQERLIRLREKQLSVRDPHEKSRKFNKMAAERERKRDVSESLGEMWGTIPAIWRGGIIGFLLGGIVALLLQRYWASSLALLVGILLVVVFIVVGILIGQAIDLRDNIKRQL